MEDHRRAVLRRSWAMVTGSVTVVAVAVPSRPTRSGGRSPAWPPWCSSGFARCPPALRNAPVDAVRAGRDRLAEALGVQVEAVEARRLASGVDPHGELPALRREVHGADDRALDVPQHRRRGRRRAVLRRREPAGDPRRHGPRGDRRDRRPPSLPASHVSSWSGAPRTCYTTRWPAATREPPQPPAQRRGNLACGRGRTLVVRRSEAFMNAPTIRLDPLRTHRRIIP